MVDKVSTLKLQAFNYLGNAVELNASLKSATLFANGNEEIDVTNEANLSKKDGQIQIDVEAVSSLHLGSYFVGIKVEAQGEKQGLIFAAGKSDAILKLRATEAFRVAAKVVLVGLKYEIT